MAAVRHLGFLKFTFLRVKAVKRPILHQRNKFRKDRSNRCGAIAIFVIFKNGGRPPSWICWAPIGTTHDDHLMVSIVVQNLVEVDAVVSITWNFQYFARLAWKRLFTPLKLGFSESFTPKMGSNVNKTHKRQSLCESVSFEPSSVKIRRRVWAIGEFTKKGINLKKFSLYFTHLPRSPPCTDLCQI